MPNATAYVDRLAHSFWNRAAAASVSNPASLGFFRILFGLFMLVFMTPHTRWLANVPQAFFDPPYLSLANLLPSFPPEGFFLMLDLGAILALGLITLGVKTRLSTGMFVLLSLTGKNFIYAFGKIDHDILVYALAACMIFSGWGRHYALLPDKPSRFDAPRLALSLLAVFVAFGMFTAGFQKAFLWLDLNPATSGFLKWFYSGYYAHGRTALLAPLVPQVPTSLFELADIVAVLFELSGFAFLLFGRRAWLGWLSMAAFFHLINTLTLNIAFHQHVLVYLAFVNFAGLGARLGVAPVRGFAGKPVKRLLVWSVCLLTGAQVLLALIGQGSSFLFITDTALRETALLYGSVLFWSAALAVLLYDLLLGSATKPKVVGYPKGTLDLG